MRGREKLVARTSAAAQVAGGGLQYVVCQQRPSPRPRGAPVSEGGGVRREGGAPNLVCKLTGGPSTDQEDLWVRFPVAAGSSHTKDV